MAGKDDRDGKFFAVRDLPEHTRRAIKVYAAEHALTMGQAVERLVDLALKAQTPTQVGRAAREAAKAAQRTPATGPAWRKHKISAEELVHYWLDHPEEYRAHLERSQARTRRNLKRLKKPTKV